MMVLIRLHNFKKAFKVRDVYFVSLRLRVNVAVH